MSTNRGKFKPAGISRTDLPQVRSHERMTYKRCPKKWYWAWRRGLQPRRENYGALQLGTWVHNALAAWYGKPGYRRIGSLREHFNRIVDAALAGVNSERAEELAALGEEMCAAYEDHYGDDPDVHVIQAEIPLTFTIGHSQTGETIAAHKLKPDLVYRDRAGDTWLMEHKTAATIETGHLRIDDQARPYGAMAERALRQLGLIPEGTVFRGIMYNFLRKALPDERKKDADGKYLNKNGTVSKRQPIPNFVRHAVVMTNRAKAIALNRISLETMEITAVTLELRAGELNPKHLMKTPTKFCPRECQFFAMCEAEEQGVDIREMERTMYVRRNPYL